ncbi:MAG TPA: GAP family protein [Streptosporangiaceae bacterium]|jgi:threonine/homoserine/homoserine lactone efflux protein
MGKALADVLPFAFGLLAAPFPIVAVILLLMGDVRVRAVVFLAAWLATVFVIVFVVALATGGHQSAGADGASPTWVHWVQIVLGVVMVAFALRTLRNRLARDPDAPVAPPAWLTAIGGMGTGKVAGLAVLLAAVNPKGLAMLLGAGAAVGAYGLGAPGDAGAALVFAVIGSLGVLVPVGTVLVLGARTRPALDRAHTWLVAHNDTVTVTVLFTFGAVFASKGIHGLLT